MNKKKIKIILIELAFALMQILLSKINIYGVSPVGVSFAVARIYFGHNLFCVTIEYLLSRIFYFYNFKFVFVTIFEIVLMALYYFAKEFFQTTKKQLMMCVFIVVSTCLSLYYSCQTSQQLVVYVVETLLKVLIALYFCKFFSIYKSKFLFFKFSNLDYLAFSVYILLLSLGMFSFSFVEKFLGLFLISLALCLFCKVLCFDKFFIISSMVSLGGAFVSGNYFYLIFSVLSAILLINFKELNKYVYCLICVVVYFALLLIFRNYILFSYLFVFFAVFCVVIIPKTWLSKLSDMFECESENLIVTKVQENKLLEIKSKLSLMSETFLTMQNNLKFLLVGKINREQACIELSQDVINRCCKNCENFRFCFMENINKKTLFESLLNKAIENKQITKDDLFNGAKAYCMKSGIIANEINQIAKMFLCYERDMKTEDSSKLIIADELGNFSDIFSNFSKMLKYSLKINKKSSNALKEQLLNNFIDSKEVVIFENELGVESVNIIAENEYFSRAEIRHSIEKIIKNKIRLKCVNHLNFGGISHATFVPASRFKIDFAVSTKAKEKQNGDNVVVTKLSDTKYFLAIADGMGHGANASKISSMVLSLIRSMFVVGLDNELILQSINKLLIPAGLDNFTTLDACVIDLEKEICSFIKLGSSVSILKHKNTSEIISCSSLPIGIISNIKPTIITKQLSFGDTIFLASDGVVDSFSNIEMYKSFINDAKIYNLQKFVDDVIFDANYQNTLHPDDMTIIAINLLKNY